MLAEIRPTGSYKTSSDGDINGLANGPADSAYPRLQAHSCDAGPYFSFSRVSSWLTREYVEYWKLKSFGGGKKKTPKGAGWREVGGRPGGLHQAHGAQS